MFPIARDSRRELEKMACGESRFVGNGVISLSLSLSLPLLAFSLFFFFSFISNLTRKERDSFEGGMVPLT